jgi:hypothetical protein
MISDDDHEDFIGHEVQKTATHEDVHEKIAYPTRSTLS